MNFLYESNKELRKQFTNIHPITDIVEELFNYSSTIQLYYTCMKFKRFNNEGRAIRT